MCKHNVMEIILKHNYVDNRHMTTAKFLQRDALSGNSSLSPYALLTSMQQSSTAVNDSPSKTWH